ncbi:MAG: PKD domain-containing protein [Bacteroidales bacterium]|nr:PKD domain-containing protein [Bacteroidales bacterium]
MVQSYTGVPFVYQATVKYYDLKPSFSIEPKALTNEKNCDYGVVLHNTSSIGVIQPNGNGGVDTIWQDLEMHPDQCTWDFGDGSPLVHGFEPEHIYAQPGTYTVSLYIEDYERECKSVIIDSTITILPEYMEKQYAADTVSICEGRLPYYYKPELFGHDNGTTRWDLNAVGDHQVNYTNALPQYNIRAWNGCDSIVKVRFDVQNPTVTIQQLGDFCDSAQTTLVANVSNVQQNEVDYTWVYMDSVMSTTDELLALSDGSYSVSIVDRTTQCEAKATYRIEPCVPNVFLPNCITPTRSPNEGPVQNDYFYLDQFVLRFISEVKFVVFSRNGEEVFYYEGKKNTAGEFVPSTPFTNLPAEMDGRLVLWDGKVRGNVIRGTYVYMLWVVSGGKPCLYKGKLTVI